jgi:hypothetical protein
MKKSALVLMGCASLALNEAFATDEPRGTLIELHSCELYAGGCVVSSESTLGGRYLLRAWNFSGGKLNGADLAGLQIAVFETGAENLAAEKTTAGKAVIYLPSGATQSQTDALKAWVKSALPKLSADKLLTRIVPMKFAKQGSDYVISAGEFVSAKVVPLGSCVFGSCGEELWYTPRSATTVFTVAVNSSSRVSEPSLKLKWSDAGKRSVFVGRFGDSEFTKNAYVTVDDFCGSAATF